jgi:hypothetical protein
VIFWWFNLITEPDKQPLLKTDDLAALLSSCTFFSKLDLKQGYHQIPMPATNIKMTAITTLFGLFKYTFQGMMMGSDQALTDFLLPGRYNGGFS